MNTIEMRGITKRFGSLTALDHVDFTLQKGEIHALLGENGAGKTTIMNVLYGLLQPDEGEILVNGRPVRVFMTFNQAKVVIRFQICIFDILNTAQFV